MKHVAWNTETRKWEIATPEQTQQGKAITLYWSQETRQWVTVPA